jgi:DNA topoisomerase-6 subunit B
MTTDATDLQGVPDGGAKRRATAEAMAAKQRDISVSEFFTKNRHLLGFDNPQKALLTSVKEAVDNSLDACEEAGILPTLKVAIEEVGEGRFRVTVEDNGPGIVKAQIPKIFAKLLYGSKFHRLKQSRGQQGIGISAAGMYGQLTTGRPIVITSKIGRGRPAYRMAVRIDARTNAPEVLEEQVVPWEQEHGTIVSIEMAGLYRGGRASVANYLEQTVVANPHLELTFVSPKGERTHWPRASEQLPTETVEIKPHPYGVELGMLIKSFQEAGDRSAAQVLIEDYSRVTPSVAQELLKKSGVDPDARAARLDGASIEAIHRVILVSQASVPPSSKLLKLLAKREDKFIAGIQDLGKNLTPSLVEDLCRRVGIDPTTLGKRVELTQLDRFATALERMQVRILPPPATCVAPIGEALIVEGLKRRFRGEFFASHTRPPAVYRGNPFVVEVGIAFGGELPRDEGSEVLRFANRVPLLYQPRACATTEAVVRINWKAYAKDDSINQRGAELPIGPIAVFVHLASVWVPFTNEAKEAIASYDEIVEEIRAGLMECGRKLATYLNARVAEQLQAKRKSLFEKYIEELAVAIGEITSLGSDRVRADFLGAMGNFVQLEEAKPAADEPTNSSGASIPAPPPAESAEPPAKARESEPPAKARESEPPAKARESEPPPSVTITAAPTMPREDASIRSVPDAPPRAPSVGEWPPRAPSPLEAPSVTGAEGTRSWLDAEIEARIAAKRTAAGAKEPRPAKEPTTASPAKTDARAPSAVPDRERPAREERPREAAARPVEPPVDPPMRAGGTVVPPALSEAVRAAGARAAGAPAASADRSGPKVSASEARKVGGRR